MIIKKIEKEGITLKEYKKLGKIAYKALEKSKKIIKKGASDLELIKELDKFFEEKEVKKAFPVNVSVNEIAAHYTPYNKEYFFSKEDVIKIDIGLHKEGFIVDTAKTFYFGEDKKKKELVESCERALNEVEKIIKKNIEINKIGKKIEEIISKFGFKPIYNLGGHSIERYVLHSGVFIPNYDNKKKDKLKEGVYAIEPFSTNGEGFVKDYSFSNIVMLYDIRKIGRIRIPLHIKKLYDILFDEFKTLPFSLLDMEKKIGKEKIKALCDILSKTGVLHKFSQLKERKKGIVSQFEHTFLVDEEKVFNLTNFDN